MMSPSKAANRYVKHKRKVKAAHRAFNDIYAGVPAKPARVLSKEEIEEIAAKNGWRVK